MASGSSILLTRWFQTPTILQKAQARWWAETSSLDTRRNKWVTTAILPMRSKVCSEIWMRDSQNKIFISATKKNSCRMPTYPTAKNRWLTRKCDFRRNIVMYLRCQRRFTRSMSTRRRKSMSRVGRTQRQIEWLLTRVWEADPSHQWREELLPIDTQVWAIKFGNSIYPAKSPTPPRP